MPNTLAHLGIHGILTGSFIKKPALTWIYLGAIIPDLPWILQRLTSSSTDVNLFDLRLYVIVQASLFFCLILSAAFSALSTDFCKTFLILGTGSFFHLLLDSLQTKWANGVHFFAPFNWRLSNFGFFWPETVPTYTITAFGLIYLLFHWKAFLRSPFPLRLKSYPHLFSALGLFSLYLLLPLFLLHGPENQDNHFVKTLRYMDDRAGKMIEIDRGFYLYEPSGGTLNLFNGEKLKVVGLDIKSSALLSIRGTFSDKNRIIIHEYHIHSMFRDGASYLGLSLFSVLWVGSYYQYVRSIRRLRSETGLD